jgi:hypothetical protein
MIGRNHERASGRHVRETHHIDPTVEDAQQQAEELTQQRIGRIHRRLPVSLARLPGSSGQD